MRGLAPPPFVVQRSMLCAPRLVRFALGALLVTAAGAVTGAASAQQFRIDGVVERERPEHRNIQFRYWISEQDCLADDHFTFDLTVDRYLPDDRFQVWAGTKNCSDSAQRQKDSDYCWLVYEGRFVDINQTIVIEARDVVARETPREVGNAVSEGTASDCREEVFSAKTPLYFMYVDINDEVIGQALVWDELGVDTQGPSAPTELRALPADDGLSLSWRASPSGEVDSHRFYCAAVSDDVSDAAAPPAPTPMDAGELDAALAPAANATPGCSSDLLTPGAEPPEALWCGSVDSGTATSGRARGLVNGRRYAVAVAAVDELGNTGALSNLACNVPEEVIDFWERYREAGGRGGGGFCGFSGVSSSLSGVGVWLVSLLIVIRRRRRS